MASKPQKRNRKVNERYGGVEKSNMINKEITETIKMLVELVDKMSKQILETEKKVRELERKL